MNRGPLPSVSSDSELIGLKEPRNLISQPPERLFMHSSLRTSEQGVAEGTEQGCSQVWEKTREEAVQSRHGLKNDGSFLEVVPRSIRLLPTNSVPARFGSSPTNAGEATLATESG